MGAENPQARDGLEISNRHSHKNKDEEIMGNAGIVKDVDYGPGAEKKREGEFNNNNASKNKKAKLSVKETISKASPEAVSHSNGTIEIKGKAFTIKRNPTYLQENMQENIQKARRNEVRKKRRDIYSNRKKMTKYQLNTQKRLDELRRIAKFKQKLRLLKRKIRSRDLSMRVGISFPNTPKPKSR